MRRGQKRKVRQREVEKRERERESDNNSMAEYHNYLEIKKKKVNT